MQATAFIDGAARGNPGPAAFAFVIQIDGGKSIEDRGAIGRATNNIAEYTALVRLLERARELNIQDLLVKSDSELLVKQMNGDYRVKNPALRELYDQASKLLQHFRRVSFVHVPREENSRADELCNQALDFDSASRLEPRSSRREVDEAAVDYLQDAALAWAKGDASVPPAADVWHGLYALLKKHKVIR